MTSVQKCERSFTQICFCSFLGFLSMALCLFFFLIWLPYLLYEVFNLNSEMAVSCS